MKSALSKFVVVFAAALISTSAFAEPGELWVDLKGSDYAKPFQDGAEYDDHEFSNNEFRLIIRLTDKDQILEFELRPSNSELAPVIVENNPKKFRKKKISRGDWRLVQKVKVKFVKAPPAPAPKPKVDPPIAPPEPAPEAPAPTPEPKKDAPAPAAEPKKDAPAPKK